MTSDDAELLLEVMGDVRAAAEQTKEIAQGIREDAVDDKDILAKLTAIEQKVDRIARTVKLIEGLRENGGDGVRITVEERDEHDRITAITVH